MSANDSAEWNIPIPHFPPFKLRSSLTDKDPVIWVHLLDGYINLLRLLVSPQCPRLLARSNQQLQLFVKLFLSEHALETANPLSLGAINPDITTNTRLLRAYVWQLLKSFSFVRLGIDGSSAWDVVKVYAEGNCSQVRGLIDGSYVSPLNDNKKSGRISAIPMLQRHLESLIANDRFRDTDLQFLLRLVGQQAATSTTVSLTAQEAKTRHRTVNKSGRNTLAFAEKFVNAAWIETLERLFAGGRGRAADTIRNIMVVSLVLLRAPAVLQLALELGVYALSDFQKFPLTGAIIVSSTYREMVPRLEERLLFLSQTESGSQYQANPQDISLLQDMFPHLLPRQLTQALGDAGGNVEQVTNTLLENGGVVKLREDLPAQKRAPTVTVRRANKSKPKSTSNAGDDADDGILSRGYRASNITFGKKKFELGQASLQVKQHALTLALRLLYESDEDEPDDLYADQEHTTGDSEGKRTDAVDVLERQLFAEYKRSGPEAFDKRARKLKQRQELKKATKNLDEQIEGWFRVLQRLPRRFKMLEEEYFFNGGREKQVSGGNGGDRSTPEPESHAEADNDQSANSGNRTRSLNKKAASEKSNANEKRDKAQKDKNKASRANHNRRQGHDKKHRDDVKGMQG